MITITPISLEYGTYFDPSGTFDTHPLAIGSIVKIKAVFDTDQNLLAGLYGSVYIALGAFLDIGYMGETAPIGTPPLPYLYYLITGATGANTPYPLIFNGNGSYENGSFTITLDTTGLFIKLLIEGTFLLIEDTNGYPSGLMSNNRKLLYNSKNNNSILNNGGSSVYNSDKILRIMLYYLQQGLSPNNSANWVLARNDAPITLSWYGKKEYNIGATDITNVNLELIRPISSGDVVTDLTVTDYTRALLGFNTVYTDIKISYLFIKTSGNDNNVHYLTNYYYDTAKDYTEGTEGTDLPTDVPSWMFSKIGNPNALVGEAIIATEVTPDAWTAYFEVNPSVLNPAYTYRLIVVIYYRNSVLDAYKSYSLITDNLLVGSVPSLVPPLAYSYLSDYFNKFTNWIRCSPLERIKSTLLLDGTPYAQARAGYGHTLTNSATKISITHYYLEGDYKNIVSRVLLSKNAQGIWVTPSSDVTIFVDTLADTIIIDYIFRIRYEPDKQNIVTVNALTGVPLPSPLGNQDWSNKLIYIEYEIQLDHTNPAVFSDILKKQQLMEINGIDTTCIDISFIDNSGNPLRNFCDTLVAFKALIKSCTDDDLLQNPNDSILSDHLITLFDKQIFGISNISEFDPEAGTILPQLQELPISTTTPLLISNEGMADINASLIEANKAHRFVAIKKKDVYLNTYSGVACTGDTETLGVGETYYKNFNVSGQSGYVIIPFRFFYSAHGLRVVYEDTPIFLTKTGVPFGGGLPGFDPYPAPDLFSARGVFCHYFTNDPYHSSTYEIMTCGALEPYNINNMFSVLCPNEALALGQVANVNTGIYGNISHFLHGFTVDVGVSASSRNLEVISTSAPIFVSIYQQNNNLLNFNTPLTSFVISSPGLYPFSYPGNAGLTLKPLIVVVEGYGVSWNLRII